MKAITYTQYGPPNVLKLREVEKPTPVDNEVLVKIYAASINSWDWDMIRGKPYLFRVSGLFKPKYAIPGADISGVVESVGKNIRKFKTGDEVFGDLCECGWGAYAEYVSVPESCLEKKPPGMTFEQAAAIPQAGVMALLAVRDKGDLKPGQKVLIIGAGGSVGTLAIQMAKSVGADVTVADKGNKLDTLLEMGADHAIDHTCVDFTRTGKQYDLIIDVVGSRSMSAYLKALSPGGKCLLVGGPAGRLLIIFLLGLITSKMSRKKVQLLMHKPNKVLSDISQLFEEGKVAPVIDKIYPLDQTAEAFRYYATVEFKGKVIIKIMDITS